MNYHLLSNATWWKIMRITCTQLLVVIMLSSLSFAKDTKAQALLSKKVDLTVKDSSLETALDLLEKRTGVKFVYSKTLVKTNQHISFSASGQELKTVLENLFAGHGILYRVLKDRIILNVDSAFPGRKSGTETTSIAVTVAGKVTDTAGLPLPGVSVSLKGGRAGAITAANGDYSIIIPDDNGTLVFSYIGFETKEVQVAGRTTVNVVLSAAEKNLEEVIVVGFGTQKKSDLTGAVQRADLEAAKDAPNVNIIQSIQGSVPGVNVGQVNSAGSTPSIRIRGTNTIGGNQNVLIVLDGIIYNGSLASINPDDVASIDVLKDASSTAIYGAQAANGVILVTTKKGKSGKPRISYTGAYTTQSPSVGLKPLGREGFLEKIRDLNYDQAFLAPEYTTPNPNFDLTKFVDYTMLDDHNQILGNNFDWWEAATKRGQIQDHQFSVSGGNETTTYLLSAGLTDQTGFIINDKYKRKSVRVNLETKPKNWWTLGLQAFASLNDYSGAEPDLDALIRQSPLLVPYDENGKLIPSPTETNVPNPFLTYDVDNYSKRNDFFGLFFTEINFPFLKGLTYRLNYGNNYRLNADYQASQYGAGLTGSISRDDGSYYDYTLDNILSFNRTFGGKHDIAATLLYGAIERSSTSSAALATDVPSITLGYDAIELGTNQSVNSAAWNERLNYQMARLNYKYNDRYLLTATLRRDGFSGFAKNEKWGLFPSAALGWIISNESFFSAPWVDVLKVRASYGTNGNMVARYASLATFSRSRRYVFGDGGSPLFGQGSATLANDNLRWERTAGMNWGLDFTLFKNRITGNIEYYNTTTTDLLYPVFLPGIIGIDQVITNVGKLKNQGFELQVTTENIKNTNFSWSSTLSFSTNKNKIVSLLGVDANGDGREDDLVANNLFIGQPLGTIFNYKPEGIYQIGDNIPSGYYPGTFRLADLTGDGKITPDDRTFLGRSEPTYRFSVFNRFVYKSFTLTAFVNSVQGGRNAYLANVLPVSVGGVRSDNSIRYNYFSDINYWSPGNPGGEFPRSLNTPAQTTTAYRNRSFVRLQDISLSYEIKNKLVSRLGITGLRVYASGKNLATWTKWQGWDPETGQGLDENGRPVMKGYSIGLNITL